MKGFFSNWIVRNLLLAAVVIVVSAFLVDRLLLSYTRHDETMIVPDFSGMDVEQAYGMAKKSGLNVVVADSINVRNVPGGCVVKQDPAAGGMVKQGRRVRLTINAKSPKMIPMPNLVGFSLRSASAELSARGLNLKTLVYVEDMATNIVLKQFYAGRPVAPGVLVPGEAGITLHLGLSEDDNQTVIPDLTGLNFETAVNRLHEFSLNVDRLVFDTPARTYIDSVSCVVYKQFPESTQTGTFMGTSVTLWLKHAK